MDGDRWTCLDFTKTVGWAERDRPDDELTSYEALLGWAERKGVVDQAEGERLRRTAAARPGEAARVLRSAVALRELLYRIFSAVGQDLAPAESDVQLLNGLLPDANRRVGVARSGDGFEWAWLEDPEHSLDRVLWSIVRSAAELLTWNELQRVKLCNAHDCGWLFVDESRNRSRRWCDMSDCGNRAKARRFRERQREDG
jgi:predicted RNA-binding Zn ribbon-like protein